MSNPVSDLLDDLALPSDTEPSYRDPDGRCHWCDRLDCTSGITLHAEDCHNPFSDPCAGCDAQTQCSEFSVDWRTRALAAERERDAMRPVVEAAIAYVGPCDPGRTDPSMRTPGTTLADAVVTYRASKEQAK